MTTQASMARVTLRFRRDEAEFCKRDVNFESRVVRMCESEIDPCMIGTGRLHIVRRRSIMCLRDDCFVMDVNRLASQKKKEIPESANS